MNKPYSGPVEYLVPCFDPQRSVKMHGINFPYQSGPIRTQIDSIRNRGVASEFLLIEPQTGLHADRGNYLPMLVQTPGWIRGRLNTDATKIDYEMASAILAARPELARWVLTENYNRPSPLPDGDAREPQLDEKTQAWWKEQLKEEQNGAVYVAQGTHGYETAEKVFDSKGESTRENPWIAFQVQARPGNAIFNPAAGMSLVDWLHNGQGINGAVIFGRVDGSTTGAKGRREFKLVEPQLATSTGMMPYDARTGLYVAQTDWGYKVSTNKS